MLKNYILVTLRRLSRNKTFTFLNIFGLTVSIAAFIIMALYIESENSYDKFHTNAKRIFRVTTQKQTQDGANFIGAQTSAPVAPALVKDFEEIEYAVRLMKAEALLRYQDVSYQEANLLFADANIFNVFSFEWIKGDSKKALSASNSIVLTKETATRYFGDEDPMGKELTLDGEMKFYVSGVVKSLPNNSHFSFDALMPMSKAESIDYYTWLFTNWYSEYFYTYLLIKNENQAVSLSEKLKDFANRHTQGDGTKYVYSLEKLTDIYLKSKIDDQFGKTGSITNVYAFSAIALFIILIACINFINLTTAQSSERAKEIGVRKVTGASLAQLRGQFISESLIVTIVSTLFALMICQIVLPLFNQFAGKELTMNLTYSFYLPYIVIFIFIISLGAGYYPAFVVSNFRTIQALKGKLKSSLTGLRVKESLVVVQFTLSTALIVCCLVVYNQLQYINSFDMGFNREQTLILNTYGESKVRNNLETFKSEMKAIGGVENVAVSSRVPGEGKSGWSMEFNKSGRIIKTEMAVLIIDQDFLNLYKIPISAGRGLNRDFPKDTLESMILNESAIKTLGFTNAEEAIGMTVEMYPTTARVIGVVKDFNFQSLHSKIEPLAMRMFSNQFRKVSIKINSHDIKSTVHSIEKKWKELVPTRPIEYSFLDDDFNNQYKVEAKFGQIFVLFTVLAVIIACLGLYGLSLITTQQRRKEIGIRKIVGASVSQLLILLSKGYVKLVFISFAIAFPSAYYFMNQWLSTFSFKIEIGGIVFILAAVIALGVALFTVVSQTLRTALGNPVDSITE